ncbi:MAG: helix-turn-helix transcriptional regulator [Candidatus Limiplasma sp.]|nr:helix-turn-helix transcriptional regulator [Candidatus Limiplasma sp.]
MDLDYKAMGIRIRNLRIKQHLTQADVAEACAISTSYVGHLERGTRKASLETLVHICETLKISTDYALKGICIPDRGSAAHPQKTQTIRKIVGVLDAYFDEWFEE